MGKPGKRKNAGVGVDFKRVKHKVGKKLPRAQNETDTSFKARAISLPGQSVAADKTGAAELLSQCGHYNDKVRRDAVAGLAELVRAHPAEARRHATQLMGAAAERISDGDGGVRTALRDALSSAVFPVLGAPALGPFVPLLMAHVGAALTHLADAIRADALAFLELLTQWRPDLVASAGLAPGLQHYAALLSRGSRGRSIKAGSLGALAVIVASLERFLARTVGAAAGSASGGGRGDGVSVAAGAASEREREEDWQRVLHWRRCAWPQLAAPGPISQAATVAEGSSGGGMAGSGEGTALDVPATGGNGAQAAAASLLDHLVQCWTECAPGSLAESPDPATAQCLAGILRCCELLAARWGLGTLGGDPTARASLSATLLAKVSPHFPAAAPGGHLQPATAEALVALNVAAAQLLCRFLPSSGQVEAGWVGRLLDWFVAVMQEGAALPAATDGLGSGEAAAAGAGRQRSGGLQAAVYRSALEGTAGVLPLVSPPRRRALLVAAFGLWQRSPLRSQARVLVLAFWRRLLANPSSALYTPVDSSGEPLLLHEEAAAWLGALPKFIYQIGSSSKVGSSGAGGGGAGAAVESALWLLLDAARCAPPGTPLAASLAGLAPQLAPLLASLLPPGGKAQGWRLVVGPLELAVDALSSLPYLGEPLLKAAALLCLDDAYPLPTVLRLLDAVGQRAAEHAADPAAVPRLLLTALSGTSASGVAAAWGEPAAQSWARHEALAAAACRSALRLGEPEVVAASLGPPLARLCEAEGDGAGCAPRPAYGLLSLSLSLATAHPAEAAEQGAEQQQRQRHRLPPPLATLELPSLALRFAAACQARAPGSGLPRIQRAAQLAAQLVAAAPELLPGLLQTAESRVKQAGGDVGGGEGRTSALAAVLPVLLEVAAAEELQPALLAQERLLRRVLDACSGAAAAARGAADCAQQLLQIRAVCASACGWDPSVLPLT